VTSNASHSGPFTMAFRLLLIELGTYPAPGAFYEGTLARYAGLQTVLVLLAPSFDGSDQSYKALAQATGLVPYDLRNRVKAGSWGLIRGVGDAGQAQELASKLMALGFPVVLVERQVAHDKDRRSVPVQGILLGERDFTLRLRDREMKVPYGALTCIVEGEVQPGRAAQGSRQTPSGTSSGSLRAVVPTLAEVQSFREAHAANQVGYLAADLHFATVLWVARIDSRIFDFGPNRTGNVATDLANLTNVLGTKCGVRVDRSVRTSSLASFADQPAPMRAQSWPPPSHRTKTDAGDNRFDTYSRLVGEAERVARRTA
jgi:hypothetical protein